MIGKIAWKNIMHKKLSSSLCICLMMFSVGIITLLLLIQAQLEEKFQRDLKDIDLVVGAKGSPLQLVLSAVYHLDVPTGNISLPEARKIMKNPMVKQAIPLAYGDSYKGYRILGTNENYLNKYDAQLKEGRVFSKNMEATLGADVAKRTGLQVGDTFLGTHGEATGGHVHESAPYTVVGILDKTNSALDNLLLSNIQSVWQVHGDEGHSDSEGDHDHDDDEGHDHDHDHAPHFGHEYEQFEEEYGSADSLEITAILLKYKNKMSLFQAPRMINAETQMQAVLPALEINRLFYMMGIGTTTLQLIAIGIMIMAGFSMFFVLYNRLRDRKYELALLRSVGYGPQHLFGLLLLEGMFLSGLGYIMGLLLSRLGLFLINGQAADDFHIQFHAGFVSAEAWLLGLTFLVGLISALLPAIRAMGIKVATVLAES